MNIWFISDTHFSHFNIIRYCNRPFKSLEQMDKALIRNWNERVKPDDLVFELGDFNFKNSAGGKKGEGTMIKASDYEKRLNGKIIHIRGNHSCNNGCKTPIEKIAIKFGGHRINLVHNPEHADLGFPINFVGHVHNAWKFKRIHKGLGYTDLINTGVDCWKFRPVSFEEIMKEYSRWKNRGAKNENRI